jgi:energy-coupling factor transporter ATP-binding protein EcfA2
MTARGSQGFDFTRNPSKIYQQGEINVTALDNISLEIAAQEFLTLMGLFGSGKSTLLHIIAGIDRATSGECHVPGIDMAQPNEGGRLARAGGVLGCAVALYWNGYTATTMGWETFSEIVFEFCVTSRLMVEGFVFAVIIGLIGTFFPAVRVPRAAGDFGVGVCLAAFIGNWRAHEELELKPFDSELIAGIPEKTLSRVQEFDDDGRILGHLLVSMVEKPPGNHLCNRHNPCPINEVYPTKLGLERRGRHKIA